MCLRRWSLAGLVSLAAAQGVAAKQRAPEPEPTLEEKLFAREVAKALGVRRAKKLTAVRQRATDGVRIQVSDHLTIQRYRFKTYWYSRACDRASRFAWSLKPKAHLLPVLIDARRREVVVLNGKGLRDTKRAQAALKAAWGKLDIEDPLSAEKLEADGWLTQPGPDGVRVQRVLLTGASSVDAYAYSHLAWAPMYDELRAQLPFIYGLRRFVLQGKPQTALLKDGDKIEELKRWGALAIKLRRRVGDDEAAARLAPYEELLTMSPLPTPRGLIRRQAERSVGRSKLDALGAAGRLQGSGARRASGPR